MDEDGIPGVLKTDSRAVSSGACKATHRRSRRSEGSEATAEGATTRIRRLFAPRVAPIAK